jgi:hypothetical protein
MRSTISLAAAGHAMSLLFSISFVLCVLGPGGAGPQHGSRIGADIQRVPLDQLEKFLSRPHRELWVRLVRSLDLGADLQRLCGTAKTRGLI